MAVSSSSKTNSYVFSSHAKRPRFFDRQQLRAADLTLEQEYLSRRTQQLTSHLHGWGVVCGAFLKDPGAESTLEEGFAIAPLGQAMHIPEITGLDLVTLIQSSPCCGAGTNCEEAITNPTGGELSDAEVHSVFLVARPASLPGEPRAGVPADCGHPGNNLEYSRQCDAVSLHIVCELPPVHVPGETDCSLLRQLFCRETRETNYAALLEAVQTCPPAVSDEENYVVLARLDLTRSPASDQQIIAVVGYEERRLLLPTQTLQFYLSCLCTAIAPTATPTPTSTPTPTTTLTTTLPPTVFPTGTLTIGPTFMTVPPFTMEPTLGVTILPTILPTGVIVNPGDFQTRPVPVIPGVDVMLHDTLLGQETSIDELAILEDFDKARLHELGVNTVLDLYTADTTAIAEGMSISEVQVAEFKDSALERMERADRIKLSAQVFDVDKGVSLAVEEVHNIGPERGKTLRRSGYGSVADIANTTPKDLAKALSVSEVQADKLIKDARTRMLRQ